MAEENPFSLCLLRTCWVQQPAAKEGMHNYNQLLFSIGSCLNGVAVLQTDSFFRVACRLSSLNTSRHGQVPALHLRIHQKCLQIGSCRMCKDPGGCNVHFLYVHKERAGQNEAEPCCSPFSPVLLPDVPRGCIRGSANGERANGATIYRSTGHSASL